MEDMEYYTFKFNSKSSAVMMDLLLTRVLGEESYSIFELNTSGGTVWKIEFWATKTEHDYILKQMNNKVSFINWDADYEKLLNDY